jgi:hypothetical protein
MLDASRGMGQLPHEANTQIKPVRFVAKSRSNMLVHENLIAIRVLHHEARCRLRRAVQRLVLSGRGAGREHPRCFDIFHLEAD